MTEMISVVFLINGEVVFISVVEGI